MLIIQDVEVKWSKVNRSHFESLGYRFTKTGDTFTIKNFELSRGSRVPVKVLCDYCEDAVMERAFKTHVMQAERCTLGKDSCVDCRPLKMKETNQIKYGVDYYTQTESFKEKSKATNYRRYGSPYYQQTEEFQEKSKQTHMKRYGVEYTMQHPKFIEKRVQTYLKNYGEESPMRHPAVKTKLMDTLYKNGTAPSSQQQDHIHNLIGGELNYPQDKVLLDIAFPEDMAYVEYDGGGHDLQVKMGTLKREEFEKRERNRGYFLLRRGWKEIRIVCESDKLAPDSDIVLFTDIAKELLTLEKSKYFSVIWDMDTQTVKLNHKNKISFSEFISNSIPPRRRR